MNGMKCVILGGCCILMALDVSIMLTIGTMFLALLDKFKESRAVTATVQSVLIGTVTCFSVVSGILVQRFGVTRVFVAATVLLSGGFIASFFAKSILTLNILACVTSGIGISLFYISITVVVRNTFDGRKREIALSALQISMGLATICYPPLLKTLLYNYGVNGAFLILGGIYLNNIVFAPLVYNTEQTFKKKQTNGDKTKCHSEQDGTTGENNRATSNCCYNCLRVAKHSWKQICVIMDFRYTIVLVGGCLVISAVNSHLIVYEDVHAWKNFSSDQTLRLFTTYTSTAVVGRGLPIILSLVKPGNDMMLLLVLSSLSACLGQLLFVFYSHIVIVFVANVLTGLTQGLIISAVTVSIANTTTEKHFGLALGVFMTIDGVLTVAGGPIFGFTVYEYNTNTFSPSDDLNRLLQIKYTLNTSDQTASPMYDTGYIRDTVKSYELALLLAVALNGLATLLFAIAVIRSLLSRKGSMDIRNVNMDISDSETTISNVSDLR